MIYVKLISLDKYSIFDLISEKTKTVSQRDLKFIFSRDYSFPQDKVQSLLMDLSRKSSGYIITNEGSILEPENISKGGLKSIFFKGIENKSFTFTNDGLVSSSLNRDSNGTILLFD
ncbi:MAG: hypothetical protein EKK61_05765 [Rickettsiales bacterium]|nr:MAG: hypothetical protein EKK61_05765 [Rickettsiales bacterium]